MKLILSLVLLMSCSHAAEATTCIVYTASPESTKEYVGRAQISVEKRGEIADLYVRFPKMDGEHLLHSVWLLVSEPEGSEYEFFVPVATTEADEQTLGLYFGLPISLLHRASLTVAYGRCRLQYVVDLSSFAR